MKNGSYVMIITTQPPLVAIVDRRESNSGGSPDMLIQAVYEVGTTAESEADELIALGR